MANNVKYVAALACAVAGGAIFGNYWSNRKYYGSKHFTPAQRKEFERQRKIIDKTLEAHERDNEEVYNQWNPAMTYETNETDDD